MGKSEECEYRITNFECPMSKGMQNSNAKYKQGTRNKEFRMMKLEFSETIIKIG
jgi:hypothetical protein